MTKQEWVQKYLEDILDDAWGKGKDGLGIDLTEEANQARLHLTKWGVGIKGEENPRYPGWFKFEPLVEGVK